jgi:Alpha-tubulin suppressor and related RCC1 domain-containing proteins
MRLPSFLRVPVLVVGAACAPAHAQRQATPALTVGWTALGPGPCAVAGGLAYCLNGFAPNASPSLGGARVVAATGGYGTVCGVRADGAGVCELEGYGRPSVVLDSVRSIAGADQQGHWCAARLAGGVRCGTLESMLREALPGTRPPGLPDSVRFVDAIGGAASCARAEGGEVWCWGDGRGGSLGRGAVRDSVAAPIPTLRFRALATGQDAFCGIVTHGGVVCWGDGRQGIVGDTATLDRCVTSSGETFPCARSPRRLPVPGAARQLAVTSPGSCALLEDARVVCWGAMVTGGPILIQGLPARVVDVAVGGTQGCARTEGGELWCWFLTGRDHSPERVRAP